MQKTYFGHHFLHEVILRKSLFLPAAFLSVFLLSASSESANVIVVGDTRLKPVIEILSGINETLDFPVKAYSPAAVKED